jgi:diguanylate cyclase (GGDEF)-like protein
MPDGSLYGDRARSFCGIVIEQGRPLIVDDTYVHEEFRTFPLVTEPPYLRAYWGAPLTTHTGFNVGTLAVGDVVPRRATDRDVEVLTGFAHLTIEFMELRAQATVDLLTGLQTRRTFEATARELLSNARQTNRPLSCIVLDVDHFKSINDEFGHAIGDQVLSCVGEILLANCRPTDSLGRIGGEEFSILTPSTKLAEAFTLAERLRVALAANLRPELPMHTASFGVAELAPIDQTVADLIARADHAMYKAKRAGRNRTCVTPSDAPVPRQVA